MYFIGFIFFISGFWIVFGNEVCFFIFFEYLNEVNRIFKMVEYKKKWLIYVVFFKIGFIKGVFVLYMCMYICILIGYLKF